MLAGANIEEETKIGHLMTSIANSGGKAGQPLPSHFNMQGELMTSPNGRQSSTKNMSEKNVSAAAAALIPGTPVPIRKPLVENNSAKATPTGAAMSRNPMSSNKATRMITASKGSSSQIRQQTHFNQQNQPI